MIYKENIMIKKISRRKFISRTASFLAAAPFANTSFLRGWTDKKPPNLLIVFPDQMRAQAQGFMKQDPVITPNLDRFSRESVVFSQAVSNYPVCSPFRAMLMTGKYPHSTGVLGNCNTRGAENGYELREEDRCWSDILKEKGYSLGYIGKWHLDNPYRPYVQCNNNTEEFAWNEWCPPNRRHGFDFWYAYGTYDLHMKPMYWADEKWGEYYRKHVRNYFAMVTGVDEQFGRILNALESRGLDRNTIVLFTSDHGNCLGIHDKISKNNHYDESMRVPFMVRWPGKIKPRTDGLLLSSPDIYPTLLDLMGFRDTVPEDVEGVSHAPLILNGEGPRPSSQLYIWVEYGKPSWGHRGVRTCRYTLMLQKMPDEPDKAVLFDNAKDKYQMHDISEKNPGIAKELIQKELIPWLKKTNDPWLKHL
jgi:arylsulfatase A-like enzyme